MAPSTANSERRKNLRRSPPGLIYVELGPSNGGMMRDLSAEGFALRAMMPVQTGEQIRFSFSLSANARIEGQGEVLWVEENGRVAGIRFVDLPVQAQTQIQSWLDGTLENAEPGKPTAVEAQSFEELREELRAPPPQPPREPPAEPSSKPHWALRFPGRQQQSGAEAQAADVIPALEPLYEKETELAKDEQTEPQVEPIVLPGLPHFTTAQEPVEIRFEPLPEPGADASTPHEMINAAAGEEQNNVADTPVLPDISDVLMQPPMAERASRWQALDELSQEPVKSNWVEWFTLSRAFGIMTLLALAVGFSVYHRAFGEGLIWLGQQMAGGAATQAPASAAEDKSSSGDTNSAETSTSPAATGTSAPSTNETAPNAQVARPLGETVPSLPANSKSSSPAVGAAPTGEPDSGQETGSSEYARALQLLHDKNRDGDLSEAIRLLWISVEKGNPSAELTLAELYWRGEGVARNCDQTRILLSAAARKGNADAEKRLRQFEREGCE